MAELDIATQDLFNIVLGSNGAVQAGLAALSECSVSPNHRIPVPANVHLAKTAHARIRIAHWAYSYTKKADATPGGQLVAVSHWVAWAYGWVTTKTGFNRQPTADEYVSASWDSDVVITTEECPDIDVAISRRDAPNLSLPQEDRDNIPIVITLVLSGKLSFLVCNHHLGAHSSGGGGRWSGYLAKIVSAIKNTYLNYDSELNRTRLYDCVHTASTLAVVKDLCEFMPRTVGAACSEAIAPFCSIPGTYTTQGWVAAESMKFRPAADLEMRLSYAPAGYASAFDVSAGLRRLINHPLAVFCPGLEEVAALAIEVSKVKECPVKYGVAANYLTGGAQGVKERCDTAPYSVLLAAVASFVKVMLPKSSLSRAGVFSTPPAELEGYSETWHQLLLNYAQASRAGLAVSNAELEAVMAAVGSMSVNAREVPAINESAYSSLGIVVDQERMRNVMHAARSVDPEYIQAQERLIAQQAQQGPPQDEERQEDEPRE